MPTQCDIEVVARDVTEGGVTSDNVFSPGNLPAVVVADARARSK
jgi:hypothetical protein